MSAAPGNMIAKKEESQGRISQASAESHCMIQTGAYAKRTSTFRNVSKTFRDRIMSYKAKRLLAARTLEGQRWELGMGILIVVHVALIIIETNMDGDCRSQHKNFCLAPLWMRIANVLLLGVYSLECALRIFAYRTDFCMNRWNAMDLLVVLTGIIDVILNEVAASGTPINLTFLRLFRIVRLIRALKLLFAIRELYLLLHGFLGSMKAIFWGALMMLALIVMWAIVAVQIIDPLNRKLPVDLIEGDCAEAFSSVWLASLWFFQSLMAGDSWGQCAKPIIKAEPLSFVIFFGALCTVMMGFGNLILAVIVARAEEARHDDLQTQVKEKVKARQKDLDALLRICCEIDIDDSGTISLEELMHAYDNHEELSTMLFSMGIQRDELEAIYRLLDDGNPEQVPIQSFVTNLHKIKARDLASSLLFIRCQVMELVHRSERLELRQKETDKKLELVLTDMDASLPPKKRPSINKTPPKKSKRKSTGNTCISKILPVSSYGNADVEAANLKIRMLDGLERHLAQFAQELEMGMSKLTSELDALFSPSAPVDADCMPLEVTARDGSDCRATGKYCLATQSSFDVQTWPSTASKPSDAERASSLAYTESSSQPWAKSTSLPTEGHCHIAM